MYCIYAFTDPNNKVAADGAAPALIGRCGALLSLGWRSSSPALTFLSLYIYISYIFSA